MQSMSCNIYGLCIVHDGNKMQELWLEGEAGTRGEGHSVTTDGLQDNIYEVPCVCVLIFAAYLVLMLPAT